MQRAWQYITSSLLLTILFYFAIAMLIALLSTSIGLEPMTRRVFLRDGIYGVLAGLIVYYGIKGDRKNNS